MNKKEWSYLFNDLNQYSKKLLLLSYVVQDIYQGFQAKKEQKVKKFVVTKQVDLGVLIQEKSRFLHISWKRVQNCKKNYSQKAFKKKSQSQKL